MHSQLLFTLLSLTTFVTIFASQDDSYEYRPICSPSIFNCGSIRNVTYPFWIKDRPKHCSYPGFELECNDNNTPEMVIESKKYQVKEINDGNQTVAIIDPDAIGKKCPPLSGNSTLNFSLFDYKPINFNVTIYFNCQHQIPEPYLHLLPCLTSENKYSYYVVDRGPLLYSYDQYGCEVSFFPLLDSGVSRLGDNLTYFGDTMKDGFSVSWVVDSGRCNDCVESGGNCGYNQEKPDQPLCYCSGEAYQGACPPPPPPPPPSGRKNSTKSRKIILGLVAAVGGAFLVLFFKVAIVIKKKVVGTEENIFDNNHMEVLALQRHQINNVEAFLQGYGSLAPRRFRYSELKKMTNSFKDKLGQGGYGGVFKGQLKDGCFVAVKVLNKSKGNGEDFINEVSSIGRTNHVNVVSLLGFCNERSIRALIYEFMSNGSLEKFIHSNRLDGKKRILECEMLFKIAIGIARGLEYLHRGCNTRILHFDIKPHNILLDDNFGPKISDFGLAKLCPEHASVVSMQDARGTMGYIAPEVFCRNIGVVSYKSDVYSYGMMVLEMVGGRKNIDARVENTSEIYFPHWIYNRIELQDSLELLGIENEADREIAKKMALVGLWCIQTNPTNRPSMSKVVEMLEGSLESLQMPPKPYLSSPSRSPGGSSTA